MTTLTPQAFVERWDRVTLSERSSYQQHFLDLCDMLDEPKPAASDETGSSYTFEKRVEKTGGGTGFADVWRRGRFAIEYKKKGGNLEAAYAQLAQYREGLELPPVMIATDIARFLVRTNFTGRSPETFEFTNRELLKPRYRDLLKKAFSDPEALRGVQSPAKITEQAAAGFARLADGMRQRGVEPHRAAHFLNRLLFCLFAEDVRLLPENVFSRVVERGAKSPESFNRNIGDLFRAMASGGEFLLHDIRRFNGGLFEEAEDGDGAVELTAEELRSLSRTAALDWREVEPAIFGTLFERSLDPSQRAKLGAHYTSREDILAVVEPVLMAPLRREWEEVRRAADEEGERMRSANAGGRRQAARNSRGKVEKILRGFAERLRGIRVLDPACGSGNFLYVALRELLDLEQEVLNHASSLGLDVALPGVGPEQLLGIETSPYAHELAQVVVWIGYLQWMDAAGHGSPSDPVLGPMTYILEMDAILVQDEVGKPVEPEWPEADVVVGNPPFLGDKRMRAELGAKYVKDLRALYAGRVSGGADLACYWFEKARRYVEGGRAQRVGLIATNGIRFGASRQVLERVKASGDIFMAWADRRWVQGDASVRVSMVGFDDGTETERILNGEPVERINPDLTALVDVTGAAPLPENRDLCFLGVMKSGPFDPPEAEALRMLEDSANPNGRPNSDVVKRRLGGQDVSDNTKGTWIVDFFGMDEREASLYEKPFEYVKAVVKPERDKNNDPRQREKWWLHARPRPKLRKELSGLGRCVITPEVAKHRLFAWMDTDVVPDHTLHVVARDDDYFFGILHSRPHELWSLSVGNFMGYGNDPRYNSSRTFRTFPFPWAPGEEPTNDPRVAKVAEAAEELYRLRRNRLAADAGVGQHSSLTALYNSPPTWLLGAHADLDRAVFACYGWEEEPDDLPEQEILKRLMALNQERSVARPA